jgi:hypothetical protein
MQLLKENCLATSATWQKKVFLRSEMAVVVDVGIHLVKATYTLEGDRPRAIRPTVL